MVSCPPGITADITYPSFCFVELAVISAWVRRVALGQAELKFYNGSKWIDVAALGSKTPDNQWHRCKATITDPQFIVSNVKVKFEVSSFDATTNFYLDELTVVGMK